MPMRLWMNDSNTVLTDEQVIRVIATFGNLTEAAQHGNIRLISTSDNNNDKHNGSEAEANTCHTQRTIPHLAEYLSGHSQ